MKRPPAWFAWLVVIAAVALAAVMRFWTDAGNWAWGLIIVAFLGVGMLLGDGDGDGGDGDSDADTDSASVHDGGGGSDSGGDGGG